MKEKFEWLTAACARFAGRPGMLVLALCIALAGAVSYVSGDEQLVDGANILISVLTLLLLPILQATQNRDGAALQAKLDELLKATADARDELIGLEKHTTEEIEELRG